MILSLLLLAAVHAPTSAFIVVNPRTEESSVLLGKVDDDRNPWLNVRNVEATNEYIRSLSVDDNPDHAHFRETCKGLIGHTIEYVAWAEVCHEFDEEKSECTGEWMRDGQELVKIQFSNQSNVVLCQYNFPWLQRGDHEVDDDPQGRWGQLDWPWLQNAIAGRKVEGIYLGKLRFSFFAGGIDDWCLVIFDLGECWLEVRTHDDYGYLFGIFGVSDGIPQGASDFDDPNTCHLVDIVRWA